MTFAFYVAKLQKHFESSKMMLQKLHQKKVILFLSITFSVTTRGLEPLSSEPESDILSIELCGPSLKCILL